MKSTLVSIICAFVLTSCLVSSTPVYPGVQLGHFSPVDICLFICNICFDDMGPEMMACANHVCLAQQRYDINLGLLKIGRTCKHFNKLDAYVFGQKDDFEMTNNSS